MSYFVVNHNNDLNRFMNNFGHNEEDGWTMMMPWLLPTGQGCKSINRLSINCNFNRLFQLSIQLFEAYFNFNFN
jgi:hypothetical protein